LYEWPAHAGAPQVLLTHGWAGAAKQFIPLGDALAAAGWRVTAIDHVAHGKSSGYRSNLPLFVQALEFIAQPMGELDLIVGHSMGAGAAAIALRRGLRARRFVSISSPVSMLDVLRGFIRSLHLPESVVAPTQTELERFAGMRLAAMEATVNAPQLAQPTLLIHDQQDKTVNFQNAPQLAALIPGAQLMATAGLGHNRILADSEVIARVIRFASDHPAAQ
jgi:pimeloyl-ACP methyl ester carboxylesterase